MIPDPDTPALRQHLTLYVPGLFSATRNSIEPPKSLRSLETLLARGAQEQQALATGYDENLFALFGLHREKDNDLPVAAVTRMTDMGVIDNDWWLRADPVHLSLEHDRLILADPQKLEVTREEANRLVAEIMEVFVQDGWLLKAPRPDRWYLKPSHAPNITTTSLTEVIGRDIHPFLPRGPEEKAWHTTLNEIQILLHTTSVNSERERHNKLPINSLWFWGGGRLPRMAPVSWSQVWSNEPMGLSLGRLAGTPCHNTPADFAEWQQHQDSPGEHLVVLDDVHGALVNDDMALRNDLLLKLELNWMRPLLQALKTGVVTSAALITDDGMNYSITSRKARRWWRFRRPLSAYTTPQH